MTNEMNENFDAFDAYALKYDLNNKMLENKYNHSYRVLHQCDELSFTLNLDEDDNYLVCLIGLLHDIGRLPQYTKYNSFEDDEEDHADMGVDILFDEGLISKFKVKESDKKIIKNVILNHNKYSLSNNLTTKEVLMAKIVKDADKLDILYQFSNMRIGEITKSDDKISEKVSSDFFNHKLINKKDIKTDNDRIIMLLSFVFDLYYEYTKDTIKDKKYYEKIEEYLDNDEIFKPYFSEIYKYLKEEK